MGPVINAVTAASKPFKFLVGPQGREFTIHSALVADLSPCLERLVNGPLQEGRQGEARWDSVDEDTFVCFWQYAYTGNYDTASIVGIEEDAVDNGPEAAPEPVPQPEPEPEPEPEPAPPVDDFWDAFGSGKSRSKSKAKKAQKLWGDLDEETVAPPRTSKQEQAWAKFKSLRRSNDSKGTNHHVSKSEAGPLVRQLLCHAKVYVFADCYGVFELMTLSYNKLHQSLVDLSLQGTAFTDAVNFVQYCYETLVPDDLKELVILFTVCEVERLWEVEEFQHQLETNGEFSKAVIGSLRSRLD